MTNFYWWWLLTGHAWRPIAVGATLTAALAVALWLRAYWRRQRAAAFLRSEEERLAREFDRARGYDRPLAERAAEAKRMSVGAPTTVITVHGCDCGVGGNDRSCDHSAFCSIWIPSSIRLSDVDFQHLRVAERGSNGPERA